MSRKAVFLDRDGVLNQERPDYVKSPEELEMLPGIAGPIRAARQKGFLVVVITNQSVVGRGIITQERLERIHDKMRSELVSQGCPLDAIYFCPHTPDDNCSCRKPQPGLILKAAHDFQIDLKESWLIGDKTTDIEAANKAGCRGIKVPANDHGLEIGMREILHHEEVERRGG